MTGAELGPGEFSSGVEVFPDGLIAKLTIVDSSLARGSPRAAASIVRPAPAAPTQGAVNISETIRL
ncbi:MAG: hypothetical protein ACLPN5_12490 [Roseiarcus sp.]